MKIPEDLSGMVQTKAEKQDPKNVKKDTKIKADILDQEYQKILSKKEIEYFFVDKSGNHCFILCADCLFYANFFSNKLQEVLINDN